MDSERKLTIIDGLPAIEYIETSDDAIWGRHFTVRFIDSREIEFTVSPVDVYYLSPKHGYQGRKTEVQAIAKRAKQAFDAKYPTPAASEEA